MRPPAGRVPAHVVHGVGITLLTIVVVVVLVTGCSDDAANTSETAAGTGGESASAGVGGGGVGGAGEGGVPHVVIEGGELLIDGTPTFLYGGDLHYFRVRDAGFDADATHAMWGESLDLMQAAGMNLVSTYLPWDYHQLGPDTWDFSGARDVKRFLQMACDRGMYVVAKPGPLITGEWPRGFGTFGAVPAWWKTQNPVALARKPNGSLFNYSPTEAEDQSQPSYLHPDFLASVRAWYARALDEVRPFLGTCLIALQVDNETNHYWGNRYDVDYSDVAKVHYRGFLAQRYGSIGALNETYGSDHASFDDVEPPSSAPGWTSPRSENPWHADWYFAGLAYVRDYLDQLKSMMQSEGFVEPDILYFTNDSPFTLVLADLSLRNVLVHDAPTKNPVGLAGLDLYPKQFPTNDHLQDQPFQADYFTRLYDQGGDLAHGKQAFAYAAELQGGFYEYPVVGQPLVRPEATDQLLARTIGRGLKGGSFYVVRDGLNADGSDYDYDAAIDFSGATSPRYDVMARWGEFLEAYGTDLLRAEAVTSRVAILTNGRYAAPQGGLYDDMQRLLTMEQPAIFGWLAAAGIDPVVWDLRLTSSEELATVDVAFYMNPDFIDADAADKLRGFVVGGGVLVNSLWPGRNDADSWTSSSSSTAFSSMFPQAESGAWQWLNASREGSVNAKVAGIGQTESFWYESQWSASFGPTVTPILHERTEPFGLDGDLVGYVVDDALGTRAFLGTYVATRFNQDDYYALSDDEIERATKLARYLVALGGVTPTLTADNPRELVWARRSPTRTYLFIVNDNDSDRTIHVNVADPSTLGIDRDASYAITEGLSAAELNSLSGTDIASDGISVEVPAWSTAVLVLKAGR